MHTVYSQSFFFCHIEHRFTTLHRELFVAIESGTILRILQLQRHAMHNIAHDKYILYPVNRMTGRMTISRYRLNTARQTLARQRVGRALAQLKSFQPISVKRHDRTQFARLLLRHRHPGLVFHFVDIQFCPRKGRFALL